MTGAGVGFEYNLRGPNKWEEEKHLGCTKTGGLFLWDEFQVSKMWLSNGILAEFQVHYWRFLLRCVTKRPHKVVELPTCVQRLKENMPVVFFGRDTKVPKKELQEMQSFNCWEGVHHLGESSNIALATIEYHNSPFIASIFLEVTKWQVPSGTPTPTVKKPSHHFLFKNNCMYSVIIHFPKVHWIFQLFLYNIQKYYFLNLLTTKKPSKRITSPLPKPAMFLGPSGTLHGSSRPRRSGLNVWQSWRRMPSTSLGLQFFGEGSV